MAAPTRPNSISDSTARRNRLKAVLDDFNNDVAAITQALEELAAPAISRTTRPTSNASAPIVVKVDEASRHYKLGAGPVHALQSASLTIRQGELIAITGPSGSGKSTLLNLIGALDRPSSGTVQVDGQDLARLRDAALARFRNRTIGFVFQFFYLQPFLTVRRNLEVPGMFAGTPPAERAARVTELAAAVGLSDRLDHLPKELSGGQMQRAAIARALLNHPKLILADEPTGNVDRANAHAILELFEHIRQTFGTTIVIVTHDPEVARAADRTIALRDGKVV